MQEYTNIRGAIPGTRRYPARVNAVMSTKEKIKGTLVKLLEEFNADNLTVKMLLMEAQISKQTLYNNYYGIHEIVEEVITEYIGTAAARFRANYSWASAIQELLQELMLHKDVLVHLYFSKYRREMLLMIYRSLEPVVKEEVEDTAAIQGVVLSDRDIRFIVTFYMDILIGTAGRFIHRRMTDDPEYLAGRYGAMLTDNLPNSVVKIAELSSR